MYLWPIAENGPGTIWDPYDAGPHGGVEGAYRDVWLTGFDSLGPITMEQCMAEPAAKRRKLSKVDPGAWKKFRDWGSSGFGGAQALGTEMAATGMDQGSKHTEPGDTYWDYFPLDQNFELGIKKISLESMAGSIESMVPDLLNVMKEGSCTGKVITPYGPSTGFDWSIHDYPPSAPLLDTADSPFWPPVPEFPTTKEGLCEKIVEVNTKRGARLPILRTLAYALSDCGIKKVKATQEMVFGTKAMWDWFLTYGNVTADKASGMFGPPADYLWPISQSSAGYKWDPAPAGPHGGTAGVPRDVWVTDPIALGPTTMAECMADGDPYWKVVGHDRMFELGIQMLNYDFMGASMECMLPKLLEAMNEGRCTDILYPYGPTKQFDWE